MKDEPQLGWFRNAVALVGAQIIVLLIALFGRKVRESEVPWLCGPTGGPQINDAPYEKVAEQEGLSMERALTEGGLIPDFSVFGEAFEEVQPSIRDFYERTASYSMDLWARTYFPANVALWLLVTTLSRKYQQLNFPVDTLETASGITSEVIHLKDPEGRIRYAGWFRKLAASDRVLYTGFYLTEQIPGCSLPCVKVVFPMPNGNATVILRPEVNEQGHFYLVSSGTRFGDPGFYRMQRIDGQHLRVWRIRSMKEVFHLFEDEQGVLRCDHRIRFLGLPVLSLHYRMVRKNLSRSA